LILIAKETQGNRHLRFEKGKSYRAELYDSRTDVYGHIIDSSEELYQVFNDQKKVMIMTLEYLTKHFRRFT